MSFSDDEKSQHGGQPIHLFDFDLEGGDQPAYYYTDHYQDLTVLTHTYTAATISRGPFVASGESRRDEMTLETHEDLAVIDELLYRTPPRSATVTVRRYHGNIDNVATIWRGNIRSTHQAGRKVSIRVSSALAEMLDVTVPAVAFQTVCNHVLGDARCTVDLDSFKKSTTVSAIDDNPRIITVVSLDGAGDNVYRGGYVERTSDGEKRLIVGQLGTVLTLVRPFRTLSTTNAVVCFQGCDHSLSTCDSKFSNSENFGGAPFVRVENLFRRGVMGIDS
jgi:uncharacterized phage protein (TIGR02218 family)